MKRILLIGGLLYLSASRVLAVANPSSVLIKVYEMRLSPNDDCSNSVTVFSNPSGTPRDFVQSPTLGTGAIPNGTYKCMLIHMSDYITYTPATTDAPNCIQGTSYTRDLFRTGDTSTAPDGTSIPGRGTSSDVNAGGVEDTPWAYFSTTGSTAGSCFDPSSKCPLSAAAVVTGDKSVTFVVNFDGKIDGTQNPCELQAPEMSFR